MIVEAKEKETVKFNSLRSGVAFWYDGELYLKIDEHPSDKSKTSAIIIDGGRRCGFADDAKVCLAHVKVVKR